MRVTCESVTADTRRVSLELHDSDMDSFDRWASMLPAINRCDWERQINDAVIPVLVPELGKPSVRIPSMNPKENDHA